MVAESLPHAHSAARAGGSRVARRTGARRSDRRVVESLARKVVRPCRRSDCPAPARASVLMDYQAQVVTLVPLMAERDPRFLEVCPTHADAMGVPHGWSLVDERDEVPAPVHGPPSADEMASTATVAVLAAVLGGNEEAADAAEVHGPDAEPDVDPADAADEVAPEPSAAVRMAAALRAPASASEEAGSPVGHDERQLVLEQLDEADSLARRARPVRAAREE